jgi:Icc-related predicted phosphoesterase
LNKQLDVDKFEELKDKIEDQMADVNERQEFFINAGNTDDNDELLEELDELEAEMAANDFDQVEIGSGAIAGAIGQQPVPAQA